MSSSSTDSGRFSASSLTDIHHSDRGDPAPTKKHRQHTASKFFVYCKYYIDEQSKAGRRFRNDEQAMESAALKYQSLSADEKREWRHRYRRDRKLHKGDATSVFRVSNGDRGDRMADPTEMARLKDVELKSKGDIEALVTRWTWNYSDDKSAFKNERFLLVNARTSDADRSLPFTELAIVEFSLGHGVLDQFRVDFGQLSCTKQRYNAIQIVLEWPKKLRRELGKRIPVFFVPNDRMAAVFNALTYIDSSVPADSSNDWKTSPQVSFAKDMSTIRDMRSAMADFFAKSRPADTYETREHALDDETDCLIEAHRIVERLVDDFRRME